MGARVHGPRRRPTRVLGAERLPHVRRPLQGAALLGRLSGIEAVVFDVGETLVDETSAWEAWADHLGVPRFTFMATLGAVIAAGDDHRGVFDILAPGIEVRSDPPGWERSAGDLYPDAIGIIRSLAGRGIRIGVAGNQAAATETFFAGLGLPIELVATSAGWGVSKPDPRFFKRIVEQLGLEPGVIAYVGDRLDNDVLPAMAVGIKGVLIRRGPWGMLAARSVDAAAADAVIDGLDEMTELLHGA